jgi:AcrR family transcriptional regulator
MSEISPRKERVDAARSRRSILDAAVRLLEEGPFAGLAEVAREAGVTRQTVYAHFASRAQLLEAVLEELVGDHRGALAQARLDEGSAVEALGRLLTLSGELSRRGGVALENLARMSTPEESDTQHDPVRASLVRLARRGQRQGEFDPDVPAAWIAAATIALGHAAAAEVSAGRISRRRADSLLLDSLLRMYAAR